MSAYPSIHKMESLTHYTPFFFFLSAVSSLLSALCSNPVLKLFLLSHLCLRSWHLSTLPDHSFYKVPPLELKSHLSLHTRCTSTSLNISSSFSLLSLSPKLLSRVTFFILAVTTYQKSCFQMTITSVFLSLRSQCKMCKIELIISLSPEHHLYSSFWFPSTDRPAFTTLPSE